VIKVTWQDLEKFLDAIHEEHRDRVDYERGKVPPEIFNNDELDNYKMAICGVAAIRSYLHLADMEEF
jgi:hypothetical protein